LLYVATAALALSSKVELPDPAEGTPGLLKFS
jgi:hypothetical protein